MKKFKLFKRCIIFLVFLILSFSSFCSSINAETSFPTPTRYKYINDYVNVVSSADANKIISIGQELENKTTAELAVVVIDSTNDIPIEDYANKLFRTWGIGKKDKDNGLLILLAVKDKSYRVEVGRGLEGAIPDVLTSRVMESLGKPYFVQNNYGEGLLECYNTFANYTASEYNTTLDNSFNTDTSNISNLNSSRVNSRKVSIIGIIALALFFIDLILNRGRVSYTILQILLLSSFHNNHRGPFGGSSGHRGGGGFGGGSSNGGGSSGSW